MSRTVKDVWDEMNSYVESGKTYHFECTNDKGNYRPFDAKPIKMGEDSMLVKVVKSNGEVKEGTTMWIDMDELFFM